MRIIEIAFLQGKLYLQFLRTFNDKIQLQKPPQTAGYRLTYC